MKPIRWSDNDTYFGPFTFSVGRSSHIGIELDSGDAADYPGCRLMVRIHRLTAILALPPIIKPYREKVEARYWDEATVKRMGRDWYWDYHRRVYGFSTFEGAIHVHRGRCTMDSSTDRTKVYLLPWAQWRFVRHSLYDLDGKHFADLPKGGLQTNAWTVSRAIEEIQPTAAFAFRDFDGEEIVATCRIEEREWKAGEGWFRWLSLFRRNKVQRALDIRFSAEVGRRKGSWKGGTIGHGIDMVPGELHEAAFRRYCDEHNLTFVQDIHGAADAQSG